MDSNEIHNRLTVLDGIKNNLEDTEKNVLFILQSFGWSSQHIKNELCNRKECPYDASHLIGASKMKQHIETCRTVQKHYNPSDKMLPEHITKNSSNNVVIDSELSASIIAEAASLNQNFIKGIPYGVIDNRPMPLSVNQMMTLYTTDERKAIYDYVISKTTFDEFSQSFPNAPNDGDSKYQTHKSHLEELAALRDMKRRRTKYKVSTKAKSYTEVMREVIENQMQSQAESVKSSCVESSRVDRNTYSNRHKNTTKEGSISEQPSKIRKHKHKSHKSKHKKSSKEKHSRDD